MMVKSTLRIAILAFICIFSLKSYASPVWKVTNGENTVYIAGTIHVLSKSDLPLPKEFDLAFNQAQHIVLETDLTAFQTPEMQQAMASAITYTPPHNLLTHISKETHTQLKAFCDARGIPLQNLIAYKPGMLISILMMTELKRLGINGAGVDEIYEQKAVTQGKTIGELETPLKQLEFLANLGDDDPDALIQYSLEDTDQLGTFFKDMVDAWRKGDMDLLEDAAQVADLVERFPEIYDQILVQRNKNWIPQIEAMLRDKKVEMVLVGALHLAGTDSVFAMLKAKGYKIKKL
jgi:uncharacterized protein YbaP (TraB family)